MLTIYSVNDNKGTCITILCYISESSVLSETVGKISFFVNFEVMKRDYDINHIGTGLLTTELSILMKTRNPTAEVINQGLGYKNYTFELFFIRKVYL